MKLLLIAIIFTFLIGAGCKHDKSGEMQQLSLKKPIVRLDTIYAGYSKDIKNIRSIRKYIDNEVVQEKDYNSGFKIAQIKQYKNGTQVLFKKYNDDGYLIKEVISKMPFHEITKKWYHDGKPMSEFEMKNQKLVETRKTWYENGQLEHLYHYDTLGAMIDSCIGFYENGSIKFKAFHPDQNWKSWYNSGELLTNEKRENNVLHGVSREYYKSGNLKISFEAFNGIKKGVETEWYDNGIIKSKRTFLNNKQNGLSWSYSSEGGLTQETNWKNGFPKGKSTSFNKDGSVKGVTHF